MGAKAEKTRETIFRVAAELFAKDGIKATSVRKICAKAGVTHNMVGHHFGGKDGLINEITRRYAAGLFASALRIIEEPAKNGPDFETRFRLFQRETMVSAVENRYLIIVYADIGTQNQSESFADAQKAAANYQNSLLSFLKSGIRAKAISKSIDVEMLTAALWDRIMVQVRYADWLAKAYGDNNILNADFQKRWLTANVDAFLFGILPR